jgi:hypothetical protein
MQIFRSVFHVFTTVIKRVVFAIWKENRLGSDSDWFFFVSKVLENTDQHLGYPIHNVYYCSSTALCLSLAAF